MIRFLAITCLAGAGFGQILESGPEGDCGINALKPSRVSHFVDSAATSKVVPKYPLALKSTGIGGKIYVRVVVNRAGMVERTCPEFVRGEKRPHRSLVVAAEAAALDWIFKLNFGLTGTGGSPNPKLRYIEGTIVFDFAPE